MNDPVLQQDAPKHPVRRAFLTGFIALFPLVVSLFVLGIVWGVIGRISTPLGALITRVVSALTGYEDLPPYVGKLSALLLAVLATYLMGLGIRRIFGARLIVWTDRIFGRLPVIRYIYPHAKTLSDFLFGERKVNFNRVVAIEYPRLGCWAVGFVTSDGIPALSRRADRRMIAVFVPTSPTPFTGWTVLVDEAEALPLAMSVDEAVRFIVSCGVIQPGQTLADLKASPAPDPIIGT